MSKLWGLAGVLFATLVLQATAAMAAPDYGVTTSGNGWTYTRLGNQSDITTPTTGGFVFEGGGTDVVPAYQWMCDKAGNGDFLVIRASGTPAYNPYIVRICPGINSVSTLIITSSKGAKDPFVLDTVAHAEALFIAGGDQANYARFWQNTPLNKAIDAVAQRGAPIGGTSAGNAIMGQFAFSALLGTITSEQALHNPFNARVTLDRDFLSLSPLLADTITDDHFVTRDRMGRLVAFLARIVHDRYASQASGIAIDEHAAFLMEPNGQGKVVGSGAVYFLRTPGRPEICRPDKPLTYANVSVYRIFNGGKFDIGAWKGKNGTAYSLTATHGVLSSTQEGGGVY